MGELRRKLEAAAVERKRAVGSALGASDFHAKGLAQELRGRGFAADVRTCAIAFERRATKLGMACLMVLALDPGMSCAIEQIEGELAYPFQHGDHPTFNVAPNALLLPILPRRKW